MTRTVVVDNNQTVVVESDQSRTIVTGIMGPRGAASFSELQDINLSQLGPGSLLIYDAGTNQWTATTLLDQQIVESGQF
jgi:hypothetical protein